MVTVDSTVAIYQNFVGAAHEGEEEIEEEEADALDDGDPCVHLGEFGKGLAWEG